MAKAKDCQGADGNVRAPSVLKEKEYTTWRWAKASVEVFVFP
jgi:hypothetical protein